MENLDPKAVRYANEKLWQQFPDELNGRQLVMPKDSKYAIEWFKHYKAYKKAQIAPTTQPSKPSSPSTPPPASAAPAPDLTPKPIMQPCQTLPTCGELSENCQKALENSRKYGNSSIAKTYDTMIELRAYAFAFGFTRAFDTMEHWFNGCGQFKEIPADKTDETKEECWENHQIMLKEKLDAGLKSKLAYELSKAGSPKPKSLKVVMEWKGGGKLSGPPFTDDNLAYSGSTIHSRVTYECKLVNSGSYNPAMPVAARPNSYECKAVEWKSWVEDNTDFEDGKFVFLPSIPTDAEMNELAKWECGANYQRSSASWTTTPDELNQTVSFKNQQDMDKAVLERHFMMQKEREKEAAEAAGGALKSSGPAEEMLKTQ